MPPVPSVARWTASAALMTAAALAIGLMFHAMQSDDWLFVENGPIETLEAIVLSLSLVPLTIAFFKTEGWVSIACIGLAAMVSVMIMRELPRCGGAFSPDSFCIPHSVKSPLYGLGPVLAVLAVAWKRLEVEFSPQAVVYGFRWIWPVAVVALILLGGQIAEDRHYPQVEEMLELAGYALLTALGCWIVRRSARPVHRRRADHHAVLHHEIRRG